MTREELRRRGAERRAALGLDREGPPALARLLDEMVYGAIWDRDALGQQDRALCALTAACVMGRENETRGWVEGALASGLEAEAVREILLQCGLYAGFAATEFAFAGAKLLLGDALPEPETDAEKHEELADLDARARAFARDLHGDGDGDAGYDAQGNTSTASLYDIVRCWGYGAIWQRPGLEVRQRLLCALAAFSALGIAPSLRKFANTAYQHGLSASEIREAVLQTAPQCGFPRALAALDMLPTQFDGEAT